MLADGDALEAPERGARSARARPRSRRAPRRARARAPPRATRVVDVVEARASASSTRRDPSGVSRSKAARSSPCSSTSRAATSSGGRAWSPRRAAVVAEVADVGRGVVVRRAAADAVLRVGGVLQRRARDARVVEPERDAAGVRLADRGELRVVGVEDEPASRRAARPPRRASARRRARARRSGRAGRGRGCRGRPPAAAAAACSSGSAASSTSNSPSSASPAASRVEATPETRFAPGRVVGEPVPRAEDLGRHRRGRRLAVRGGDDRAPRREPGGEAVDRAGVERARGACPGIVVPPPAADASRERGDAARGGDLEPRVGDGARIRASVRRDTPARDYLRILQPALHIIDMAEKPRYRALAVDRSAGARGVPGRYPQALHGRADRGRDRTRAPSGSGARRRCASSPPIRRPPCIRRR